MLKSDRPWTLDDVLYTPVRKSRNGPIPRSVAERLRELTSEAITPTGCRIFMGTVQSHPKGDGYGQISARLADGRHRLLHTHQVAYAIAAGRVAERLVLHKCDVKLCLEPAHLYEGIQRRNVLDSVERGRHVCGYDLWRRRKARGV